MFIDEGERASRSFRQWLADPFASQGRWAGPSDSADGEALMVWTHRFRVNASVDDVYTRGLAPDRWFSFFPAYRGVETVDSHWPQQGSAIVIRYRILGPWTMRLCQTVVQHDPGRFIQFHEEALGGLWIDQPRFDFAPNPDGSVSITLTVSPTSRFRLAMPLIWLVSLPFTRLTPKAMARFAATIEHDDEVVTGRSRRP